MNYNRSKEFIDRTQNFRIRMNVTKYRILDLIAIICSPNKGYKTVLAIDYSEPMLMSEISTGCGFYNNLLKKHRHIIRIIWNSPLDNCGFIW